jgi:hypothetical protein
VRGSVKAWVPATVTVLLLAGGIGAAAYYTLGHGTGGSPSPTPSVDLHSKEAVIAAIKHYYAVEAEARRTGNADLIDAVTIGHNSIASQNFHTFIAEQTASGRRGVVLQNYYADWATKVDRETATAEYKFWLTGYDTDLAGRRVEPDNTTSKGSYRMRLQLTGGYWLVAERDLLQDNVP